MNYKFSNIIELLQQIPKEKVKQDTEFQEIYKYLKLLFEEKDESQKALNCNGDLIEEFSK
ncbi:MAG: hypothetical protein PHP82_02050 [Candidatus ainarchaeum sp.]|nr:hypothetical protein [Candidatus ainarchaeum sp.]